MIVCNKHHCWKINRIPTIELINKTKQNKNEDISSAFRHSFDCKRVNIKIPDIVTHKIICIIMGCKIHVFGNI